MATFSARTRLAAGGLPSIVVFLAAAACSTDIASPYPGPGISSAVTIPYCSALAPSWVAFQDGDGPWERAVGFPGGGRTLFQHEFVSPRGAVATVTPFAGGAFTVLRVFFGSPAELASEGDTLRADCEAVGSRNWHGHIDGLGPDEKALVSTGLLLRASVLPSAPDFQVFGIPGGQQDVLATRTTLGAGGALPTALILRRDIDLPDEATLPNFDFTSPEALAPALAMLSIVGAGGEVVSSLTELHTRNSRVTLPFISNLSAATVRPYFAVPVDRLVTGDVQLLHVSTDESSGSSRTADVFFRDVQDRTLVLGVPVVAPTLGVEIGGTSPRVRALFGQLIDYEQSASLVLQQAGQTAVESIAMTAQYSSMAVGSGGFELVVPDLSAVAGFQESWALRPHVDVAWFATRSGGTVPLGRNALPTDGAVRRTASIQGVLTVP